MSTDVIDRQEAISDSTAEGSWGALVEEVVLDEVSAWRLVALRLAGELRIPTENLSQAVLALRELVGTPMPAGRRSHQRNRIFAAMHGQRPVSGGRRPVAAREVEVVAVLSTVVDDDTPPAAGPEARGAPFTRVPRIVSRVRELREALGMTQTEVGARVGALPPTVSQWENGHHIPRVATQRRLAELYGVTTADLHLEPPPVATSHQRSRVSATDRPNGYRYAGDQIL